MSLIFASFTKLAPQDDGTIRVAGYASTEALDKDGEIILSSAIADALPDYRKFPALREMHSPKAIGKALSVSVQPDGRTWIEAHVVDSDSVAKVKAGVLRGFSIGGKVLKRHPKKPNVITKIRLSEVSLVDSPANPECEVVLAKFDQPAPRLAYEAPGAIAEAAAGHILASVAHESARAAGYRPGSREYITAFGQAFEKAQGIFTVGPLPPPTGKRGAAGAPSRRSGAAPHLFNDLYKAAFDPAEHPRDRDGEFTATSAAEHRRLMATDEEYRAAHSQVIEENRGTRRGRPWGMLAGAVAGGAAAAALGATAPSRTAGVIGGAAAGAAVGAARGALRGLRKPGPWPSKAANAAFAAATDLTRGILRGAKAGAKRPKAANALTAGALGAVAGGAVGGAIGETVGAVHDRMRTTRTVAKYSPSQRRDQDGRFANDGAHATAHGTAETAGRLLGGLIGGTAGGVAAGALALPAGPAALVATSAGEVGGAKVGEASGGYLGHLLDLQFKQDTKAAHEASRRRADHQAVLDAIKAAPALAFPAKG